MNIVLDTNVLLVSIAKKSIYRPIFDALLQGKFNLIITSEIISEYEEIIGRFANEIVAANIVETILNLQHTQKQEVYYKWSLITQDPDDDKFVDAAVAGNADYIVTNDAHFNILKSIEFPPVSVINIDDFLTIVSTL